jgi:enamine deaminase RidA (YjgF/YER057c/UK114 family)
MHKVLQPPGWPRPRGYANGISARGRTIFTGGMIGWDQHQHFQSPELTEQFAEALRNVLLVLAEDCAGPEHIVRMTVYVTDMASYRASLGDMGTIWRELMGRNYPAMALIEVRSLVEPAALVEIEATAVVEE